MTTPLERAFELAKSGRCRSVDEIRRVLQAEGYGTLQLEGPLLRKQLRDFILKAKTKPDE